MTPKQFKTAVNNLTVLLGMMLPATDNQDSLIAYYMLLTGYEARDHQGEKLDIPLFGGSIGELTEALTGTKRRLHQLIDKNRILTKTDTPGYEVPIKAIHFTGEKVEPLLAHILHDPIAWIAAKKLAAIFLKDNRPLPDSLRLFAAKALESDPPSAKRGKNSYIDLIRNATIVNCIEQMNQNGFSPITKSNESSPTLSLCDAVSEALQSLGIHLSYLAVKTIYERAKPLKGKLLPFRLTIEPSKAPIV